MSELRHVKTEQQFKKGSILEVSEPIDEKTVKRKYKVVASSDLFNPDNDGYFCTILEEIKE